MGSANESVLFEFCYKGNRMMNAILKKGFVRVVLTVCLACGGELRLLTNSRLEGTETFLVELRVLLFQE